MLQQHMHHLLSKVRRWPGAFMRLAWPLQLGMALLAAAVLCLLQAWSVAQETDALHSELQRKRSRLAAPAVAANTTAVAQSQAIALPPESEYLPNLQQLFEIGRKTGLSFGVIEYKQASSEKSDAIARGLELSFYDEYPRIKTFVAQALAELPHATLRDIRMERSDAMGTAIKARMQMVLLYQTSNTHINTAPAAPWLRLDSGSLQNPFGMLDLMVTVESLSKPRPETMKPAKAIKKAPPPPPPEPVVVAPPPPPPAPVAPPLPFRVLGALQSSKMTGDAKVIFLADRDSTLAVKAGDEINGTYRVERITANQIEFIYLPLKTKQVLPISH